MAAATGAAPSSATRSDSNLILETMQFLDSKASYLEKMRLLSSVEERVQNAIKAHAQQIFTIGQGCGRENVPSNPGTCFRWLCSIHHPSHAILVEYAGKICTTGLRQIEMVSWIQHLWEVAQPLNQQWVAIYTSAKERGDTAQLEAIRKGVEPIFKALNQINKGYACLKLLEKRFVDLALHCIAEASPYIERMAQLALNFEKRCKGEGVVLTAQAVAPDPDDGDSELEQLDTSSFNAAQKEGHKALLQSLAFFKAKVETKDNGKALKFAWERLWNRPDRERLIFDAIFGSLKERNLNIPRPELVDGFVIRAVNPFNPSIPMSVTLFPEWMTTERGFDVHDTDRVYSLGTTVGLLKPFPRHLLLNDPSCRLEGYSIAPFIVDREQFYVITEQVKKSYGIADFAFRVEKVDNGLYSPWGMKKVDRSWRFTNRPIPNRPLLKAKPNLPMTAAAAVATQTNTNNSNAGGAAANLIAALGRPLDAPAVPPPDK